MQELLGKKLLILGATPSECSLVKRAQELGIYVIVTDKNLDWTVSPAKYVADEAWDVSWSDIDALEEKCRKEQVDGVTAGYSEFRVENMIKLCQRLNKPCYITTEQLNITRDKVKFKNICRENFVPVVKEYEKVDEVLKFPVIVKPTDRAGSIGISIARNKKELIEAYNYAMEKSISKSVIIEDFIDDGTKFDVYYAVEDGIISLLTTCDTINAKENGFSSVVQSSWLYPSRYEKLFHENVEKYLINMIKDMKILNGCIFFSGFVRPNNEFVFFECGFRMEGGHQYGYTTERGPYNFLDLFIMHALTGNTKLLNKQIVKNEKKCVTINLYSKEGTIGKIIGFEDVANMEGCTLSLKQSYIGEECNENNAILTKLGMFSFCDNSAGFIKEQIDTAYKKINVLSENGTDLIYDRIDTDLIKNWWN